jgi:hypothetical protein
MRSQPEPSLKKREWESAMNDNGPQARYCHLPSRERARMALARMDQALAHWSRHGQVVLMPRNAAVSTQADNGHDQCAGCDCPARSQDLDAMQAGESDCEQPLPDRLRRFS